MRSQPSSSKSTGERIGVIVLGMHRSGTSALARVLNLLGCDLPKTLIEATASNEAGHWESLPIAQLNDRILDSAGSSWWDWMPFNPGWYSSPKAAEFKEEAIALLDKEFGAAGLFVLKDPRMCRFAPFWIDVLSTAGVRPAVIMQLRNPLEVAESLSRRDGFHPALGQLLWLRNVLEAEAATRSMPRYCTSYDVLMSNWPRIVAGSQEALDLSWPRMSLRTGGEIDAFLSGQLRHHNKPAASVMDDARLSAWLRETYAALNGWAHAGEAEEDHDALDRIRSDLDAAAPAFAKLVSVGKYSADRASKLQANLDDVRARLTAAEAAVEEKQAQIHKLEQAQAEAAASATALAEAQAEASRLRAEAEAVQSALDEARGRLSHLQSELAQRQAEADDATQMLQEVQQQRVSEMEAERSRHAAELQAQEQRHAQELEAQQQNSADIEAQQQRHAEELEALQQRHAQAIEELEKRHADALRDERALHSAELELREDRHINLLLEERENHGKALADQRAAADRDLQKLRRLNHDAEARIAERFSEIATLTRMLSERERQVQISDERAARLKAISTVLLNGSSSRSLKSRMRALLPAAMRLSKQKSQLASERIFDPDAYLEANPDVAEAGVDPLWHYLNHGIEEGRQLQPSRAGDA